MNKFITSLLITTILLFIAFGGFFLLHLGKLLKIEQPVQTERNTYYDAVTFCQHLSATTTNEDWGYKSCKKELFEALEKDLSTGLKLIN